MVKASSMAETNLTVLVTPSEVEGQWIGHCLNIDLVTQGESIQHAFAMVTEAVREVVRDDLAHGLDPLHRPQAPQECWDLFVDTTRHGKPLTAIDDPKNIRAIVGYVQVIVPAGQLPASSRPPEFEVEMLPPVWQIAALREMRNSQRNFPC
jgi:hypothetical protein